MPVFMFTDIASSTRLWEEHPKPMSRALERHDEIIRQQVEKHDGRIIKSTGDGALALFHEGEPLKSAIAIQKEFIQEEWPKEIGELLIRVGLHSGSCEERGGDIYGPDVNRAARVMDAAWGGQILITDAVLQLHSLPDDVKTVDFGGHLLKDLADPQQLFGLIHPDLRQDFPPIRSISDHPNNLPTQNTPFIGRQQDLKVIKDHLTTNDCRMVTVLGPGGMGKTRLGIQAAAENINRYSHGAYFIPLAPLNTADGIVPAIASALKFPLQEGGDSKSQLFSYLGNKEMLLVMDNFEHVVEGANLVNDLISAAPNIQTLVTSRTRLKLSAECIYELEPMPFPKEAEEEIFENFDAVQLFMDYAQRAHPDFTLDENDRRAVVKIFRLVSGMPLGIQLAANWVHVLSPTEIAEELQADLDFLEAEMVDLPERQRSMRAVFDYSWKLLDQTEKDTLMKLAIFRGGCTASAARTVTGASIKTLAGLVDKSLVHRSPEGRFELHELIRQFAQEKLKEQSEINEEIKEAHVECYLSLVASLEEDIKGKRQLAALDELDADLENIKLAWDNALFNKNHQDVFDAVEGVYLFTLWRSHFDAGRKMLQDARQVWPATEETDQPALAVRLLLYYPDEGADPETFYRDALKFTQEYGNENSILFATNQLGRYLMHYTSQIEEGERILHNMLAAYQKKQDHFSAARVLDDISFGYSYFDLEKRIKFAEDSFELRRKIGDRIGEVAVSINLAVAYYWRGDIKNGLALSQEALETAKQMNNKLGVGWHTLFMGEFEFFSGNFEEAREFLTKTAEINQEINHRDLEMQINLQSIVVDVALNDDFDKALEDVQKVYPKHCS